MSPDFENFKPFQFDEKLSLAQTLYVESMGLGRKKEAAEILNDADLTPDQKIERLRDLIGSVGN